MEGQRQALAKLAMAAVWAALAWAAARWVLPLLMPFLIAFALSALLRVPARALARRARIAPKPAAGLLLCLVAAAVLGGLGCLAARLLVLARLAIGQLPAFFAQRCVPLLEAAAARAARLGGSAWDAAALLQTAGDALRQLCARAAQSLGAWLAALPGLLVPFVFTCVATVYLTLDYDALLAAAARRLGARNWQRLRRAWRQALGVLGRMARVYCTLFCLTFAQLAAGLWLLRVPGALGVAGLVAVVDVLPVLGVGTVLLPWALVCALSGQGRLAAGLLALYAVVWTVRQLCEPRLVGRGLGLHPLLSLACLYVGLRLFGLVGALAAPCAATLLCQMRRAGAQAPAPAPPHPPQGA